jgi:hypothetical protein
MRWKERRDFARARIDDRQLVIHGDVFEAAILRDDVYPFGNIINPRGARHSNSD